MPTAAIRDKPTGQVVAQTIESDEWQEERRRVLERLFEVLGRHNFEVIESDEQTPPGARRTS